MKKNHLFRGMAIVLTLVLCLAGMTGAGRVAAADDEAEIVGSYPYTTVTKVNVNMRASRSVKSELLKRIPEGAEISVLAKNGNWAQVDYGNQTGWVRTEYIVLKTVKKIRVTPTPTPVPTLSPEEDAGGYEVLRRGSSGQDVISLQEALIELGFLTGSADGNFGETTEKAVIAFQKKNQYPDTGLVDANLQAFLYSGKPLNAKGTATKINTASPVPGATLRMNNTGTPVSNLQHQLKDLGYYSGEINARYDSATKKAVVAFQKKNGLTADGIAGAMTRSLLNSGTGLAAGATATPEAPGTASATPSPTPTPEPEIPKTTVKRGSSGNDAKTVQSRLKELGYYQGTVDGKFERASVNALKNFQTNNGLKADGIAGTSTYEKLFSEAAVSYRVPETVTSGPAEIPQTTAAAETSVWKTLRSGMSGTDVKQLQENLIQLGYLTGKADGNYGAKTVEAVRNFQKANNLTADGTAGAETLKKIYGGNAKAAATPTPAANAGTGSTAVSGSLKTGSTGSAVQSLQNQLIALGYLNGKADGVFGRKTAAAVRSFQRANKLTADGIAGSKTLQMLETRSGSAATATPAPTTTPVPTAPPVSSTSGQPSSSRVIYANWYTSVKDVCKQYPYCTIYDYSTGISWQIHIFSVGAHADFEPVTANDTARMQRAFGGETTWNPKAVWVVFPNGSVYMASTHDTPHGVSHISDNNFAGHSCLHFPRTQEQVNSIGQYATSHQETIDQGWAATQKMNH